MQGSIVIKQNKYQNANHTKYITPCNNKQLCLKIEKDAEAMKCHTKNKYDS